MQVLRDIFQRRARSLLTVLGIAIGVFALVVLGAMAEKAHQTMQRNGDYYADKIVVAEEDAANDVGYTNGTRPLDVATIEKIAEVPGVLDVAPQVAMLLDPTTLPFGVPPLLVGGYLGTDKYEERWDVAEGRMITDEESGVTVIGKELVDALDAELGSTVEMQEHKFEVVGILEQSLTTMDQSAMIPIGDARLIFAETLPDPFQEGFDVDTIALQATVYVAPGTDADELARTIENRVDGIKAMGPAELKQNLGQLVTMFNMILAAVGTLALLIGGLSIVNTMMLSVTERVQEIGIKRAIGASRWRIGRDTLLESAVIGGVGGVVGIGFGAFGAQAANATAAAQLGMNMFTVSGRLLTGSLVFAIALGVLAGAYPAWRASRMDPVDALAYE